MRTWLQTSGLALLVTMFLTVLLAGRAVAGSGEDTTVLTRTPDGLYLITGHVNGEGPFEFLIDTAANEVGLSQTILNGMTVAPPRTGETSVLGLTDVSATALIGLNHLVAGPFQARELRAANLETGDIRHGSDHTFGILGTNMLFGEGHSKRYVDLNLSGQTVSIFDHLHEGGIRARPDWQTLDHAILEHNLLAIDVTLNGVKGVAILDTGLPFAVVNSAYANAINRRAGGPGIELEGVNRDAKSARTIYAERLRLAGKEWARLTPYVLDSPVFERMGLRDQPAMLLGAPNLSQLRILYDTKSERIAFALPGEWDERLTCTGSRVSCIGSTYRTNVGSDD